MDWLEFIASVVDSLAWPIAVVVAAVILRNPIGKAMSGSVKRWKAGPSGVEVEYWEEAIEALRHGLPAPAAEPETAGEAAADLGDELTAVAAVSPRAAVMEAFAQIEQALRALLPAEDVASGRELGGTRLARVVRARGRINDKTLHAIEGMSVLRNLAAHGADEVDPTRATEFIALADAVLYTLRRADGRNR